MKWFLFSILFCFPLFLCGTQQEKTFRNYGEDVRDGVKEFYFQNHTKQTLSFAKAKREEYKSLNHTKMTVWEAMQALEALVDDSDPDLELSQINHAFQTAEAIRKDGHPRWLILVGLIHDLGKALTLFGEPSWAIVGDTFPLGCAFSDQIVFSEFFAQNPDQIHPIYSLKYGIYSPGCGFENLIMSWGHDEYLYQVVKNYLPEEASYIIRFHSFYSAHQKKEYAYLMNDADRAMMAWLHLFNQYDLYSKENELLDYKALMPYYQELVEEFLPGEINW